MNVADVLRDTKARLTPETWTQGHSDDPAKMCLGNAITDVLGLPRTVYVPWGRGADVASALQSVTGAEFLGLWNDAEGRTLEEVHAALDAAIAAVQS